MNTFKWFVFVPIMVGFYPENTIDDLSSACLSGTMIGLYHLQEGNVEFRI